MCAQQIAVKTNGLSLLAGVPNLGCELVVGERSSVDLSFYGGYKPWGQISSLSEYSRSIDIGLTDVLWCVNTSVYPL